LPWVPAEETGEGTVVVIDYKKPPALKTPNGQYTLHRDGWQRIAERLGCSRSNVTKLLTCRRCTREKYRTVDGGVPPWPKSDGTAQVSQDRGSGQTALRPGLLPRHEHREATEHHHAIAHWHTRADCLYRMVGHGARAWNENADPTSDAEQVSRHNLKAGARAGLDYADPSVV
jgi:hypothetical protein